LGRTIERHPFVEGDLRKIKVKAEDFVTRTNSLPAATWLPCPPGVLRNSSFSKCAGVSRKCCLPTAASSGFGLAGPLPAGDFNPRPRAKTKALRGVMRAGVRGLFLDLNGIPHQDTPSPSRLPLPSSGSLARSLALTRSLSHALG
jgi:hypothetical protein